MQKHDINDSGYKYTVSDLAMTKVQRDFYETNGYLVVPKLVPDYLIDRCCKRFKDLCDGTVPRNGITLMKEVSRMKGSYQGENLYCKAQDILWDEEFYEYARYPKLLDYIESIIGPNIMSMNLMHLNKLPDTGANSSRHPIHQDLHYFPFRPANLIVASWTACVPTNIDNGCLFVFPGTHTVELQPHGYPDIKYGKVNVLIHEMKSNIFDNHKKVFLEMDKGDTVFFHPQLIHGSGINKTQESRIANVNHYASSNCYYTDVTGTVQENIQNEIYDLMDKKGIKGVDYNTYWKNRCRLVRGVRESL